MYRQLDGALIVETLDRLQQRIAEQFPGSGLSQVGAELSAVARESIERTAVLRRPYRLLRIASGALIVLMVALGVSVVLTLNLSTNPRSLAGLMESQAIQNFVFLGVAVLFLATVETRLKRRRALTALHELRSIAHVVDMHQLSKTPDRLLPRPHQSGVTAGRRTASAELAHYLDCCTDLLSLTSKVAALYVENLQDPVVLAAVNDVENLTTGLSRTIWQKISILDTIG